MTYEVNCRLRFIPDDGKIAYRPKARKGAPPNPRRGKRRAPPGCPPKKTSTQIPSK